MNNVEKIHRVDIDINKECEQLRAKISEHPFMTVEMDILRYVKTNIPMEGRSIQEGKMLHFCRNATGEHIADYLVPSTTTEDEIEDAVERISEAVEQYGVEANGNYADLDYAEAICNAFKEVGVKVRLPEFHNIIHL